MKDFSRSANTFPMSSAPKTFLNPCSIRKHKSIYMWLNRRFIFFMTCSIRIIIFINACIINTISIGIIENIACYITFSHI